MMKSGSSFQAQAGVSLLLVAALFFLAGAQDGSRWQKAKEKYRESAAKKKEKKLRPAEETYVEAESFFQGRETWWGRQVKKSRGEDSPAYQSWPGIKRKNYPRAMELYQEVVDNYPFSKYAPLSELRIAECDFALEEYEEAGLRFDQFVKMHPRHEQVPYALYQEGLCHYKLMRKPGRDQDETRQALARFEDLRTRFPASPEAKDAQDRILECRKKLVLHEFLVADFYFKHKEYWSAAARYQGVSRDYSGLGFDDRAIFMEGSCYQALGKADQAAERFNYVISHFPDGEYAKKAQERIAAPKAKDQRKPE